MKEIRWLIIRWFVFIVLIIGQIEVNLFAFRSQYPILAAITFAGSVIIMLFFPYNRFFRINNNVKPKKK
jgi:uncharacterized integral membrane protein